MTEKATFGEIQRCWISASNDEQVKCYEGMRGRVALTTLIEHLAEVAPGIPLDQFGINYATVTWVNQATEDERAKRAEQKARSAERHAKWEQETYERLKAKFEGGGGHDQPR